MLCKVSSRPILIGDEVRVSTPVMTASATQGNRVKKSCGNEACEEIVVPGGDFAFGAEAWLAWGLADEIVGHVLDGGEVGGGVLGADAAFVVAEDHVHDPMEAVLDGPMAADDGAELAGQPCQ